MEQYCLKPVRAVGYSLFLLFSGCQLSCRVQRSLHLHSAREKGARGSSGATGVAEAAVQLGIAAGNSITHCICHCKPLSDFPLLSMKFSMSTTCQWNFSVFPLVSLHSCRRPMAALQTRGFDGRGLCLKLKQWFQSRFLTPVKLGISSTDLRDHMSALSSYKRKIVICPVSHLFWKA